MDEYNTDVIQGTLDMLVLKTVSLQPMHGFGIARRIEETSRGTFRVNPGSLLTALKRLERGLAGCGVARHGELAPHAVLHDHASRAAAVGRADRGLVTPCFGGRPAAAGGGLRRACVAPARARAARAVPSSGGGQRCGGRGASLLREQEVRGYGWKRRRCGMDGPSLRGRITTIQAIGSDGAPLDVTFGTYRELVARNHSYEAIAVMKPWQPTTPPPLSPARGPPQHDFGFDVDPGPCPGPDIDPTPAYDLSKPEPIPDFDFDQSHGA